MKERVILHCDINNFFASVECSTRPELKGLPVAVTGNPKKRTGIILAKNEIAKSQGVKTGEAIWEAKVKCPDLVTLPPHYALYEEISEKLQELYLGYTDFVEPLGLDECWLDVTDSLQYLKKSGKEIADEIREKIKREFNFTASVGVPFSKIFAKLGSDMKKPDATTVITSIDFKDMVYTLPLNSIVGIGRRLEKRFAKMNVNTIGEFVLLSDDYLKAIMGITGVYLKHSLLGDREEKVLNFYELPPPKSIGNGTTTLKDIISRKDFISTLSFLAEKVSARLIKHGFVASTLTVTIKTNEFARFSKSQKIPPTQGITQLVTEGMKIVDSFWKFNRPIRAIQLRASSLSSDKVKQLSFFDKKDLSKTIVEINKKYGHIALASDKSDHINTGPRHE